MHKCMATPLLDMLDATMWSGTTHKGEAHSLSLGESGHNKSFFLTAKNITSIVYTASTWIVNPNIVSIFR